MAVAGVKELTRESCNCFLLSITLLISSRSKDGVVSKVGIGGGGVIVLIHLRPVVVLKTSCRFTEYKHLRW